MLRTPFQNLKLMREDNFPDFLIVGAGKSGTSSLHNYLLEHPDVFLPKHKELYFWHIRTNPNKSIIEHLSGRWKVPTNLEDYLAHFEGAEPSQVVGEATPSYLHFYEHTIQSLKELHPRWRDVKIVIIIRDPVDRIFSLFRFVRLKGLDPECLSLEESLLRSDGRAKDKISLPDLSYYEGSNYAKSIRAFMEEFSSVKVLLYDDLKTDAQSVCDELCDFINVDANRMPKVGGERHNQSKSIKEARSVARMLSPYLKPIWKKIPECSLKDRIGNIAYRRRDNSSVEISDAVLIDLYEHFLPQVDEVERLIGRDLSAWKKRYLCAIEELRADI